MKVGDKSSEGGIIPNRGSTLRSPSLATRCGSRNRIFYFLAIFLKVSQPLTERFRKWTLARRQRPWRRAPGLGQTYMEGSSAPVTLAPSMQYDVRE